MRAEKRKKYIPLLLVIALLLSVPATYIRVLTATPYIGRQKIAQLTGESGTITDRYSTLIYDGTCVAPETIGNLTGGSRQMSGKLVNVFEKELAPSGFNPFQGFRSLENCVAPTMTTTLIPLKDQKRLQEVFGSYNGALFAYNYRTGEIYCMLSLPSSFANDATDGAYTNRCLTSVYIPGSTMKIVCIIVALNQNKDLQDFKTTCTGQVELPDGQVVKCHNTKGHGEVDMVKGIGVSCNVYIASLIQELEEDQAREVLEELGIATNGKKGETYLDRLYRYTSSTVFRSAHTLDDVWGLIGQGDSLVSVIDMAMIAGSVVNGGQVAQPYLVESIGNPDTGKYSYQAKTADKVCLIDKRTANLVDEIWSEAVQKHYSSKVDDIITHAKTGTTQETNGQNNRTLMGVMEEYDTAFFLVVENLPSGDPLIFDIANTLADILPKHVN